MEWYQFWWPFLDDNSITSINYFIEKHHELLMCTSSEGGVTCCNVCWMLLFTVMTWVQFERNFIERSEQKNLYVQQSNCIGTFMLKFQPIKKCKFSTINLCFDIKTASITFSNLRSDLLMWHPFRNKFNFLPFSRFGQLLSRVVHKQMKLFQLNQFLFKRIEDYLSSISQAA